jgi:dethiobiotin synthetase
MARSSSLRSAKATPSRRSAAKTGRSTRVIFITGTDTGVGKTLLTALLLAHLRRSGVRAVAIKPFCSGDRDDPKLLHSLLDGQLSLDEINPFYFPEPLAPLVAARKHHRKITLQNTVSHISRMAARLPNPIRQSINPSIHCSSTPPLHHSNSAILGASERSGDGRTSPVLVIEGVGGLLVPLGENYTVLDLITRLNCEIIVVSRNQLGTINHTLLTIHALQTAAFPTHSPVRIPHSTLRQSALRTPHSAIKVAVMDHSTIRNPQSTFSNPRVLTELLAPVPLVCIPFLGPKPKRPSQILRDARRLNAQLTRLLA